MRKVFLFVVDHMATVQPQYHPTDQNAVVMKNRFQSACKFVMAHPVVDRIMPLWCVIMEQEPLMVIKLSQPMRFCYLSLMQ